MVIGFKMKRVTGCKGNIGPIGRLLTPATQTLPQQMVLGVMTDARELLEAAVHLVAIQLEEQAAVVGLPTLLEEVVEEEVMVAIPIQALALPVLAAPPNRGRCGSRSSPYLHFPPSPATVFGAGRE